MKPLQTLLLVLMAPMCAADEGFRFGDIDMVVLINEEGGSLFAPPQGYRAEYLDATHHFAILSRVIQQNRHELIPLDVDVQSAQVQLKLLADGKSYLLFVGDHWLSDGENTVFLNQQDYADMQRVLDSQAASERRISPAAVSDAVENYKENWQEPAAPVAEPPDEKSTGDYSTNDSSATNSDDAASPIEEGTQQSHNQIAVTTDKHRANASTTVAQDFAEKSPISNERFPSTAGRGDPPRSVERKSNSSMVRAAALGVVLLFAGFFTFWFGKGRGE